jgi:UDP-N-acetylglucosamine 4,6-dehydratase
MHDSQTSYQFTIQQVSDKLDIPKPTLRFWEKELEGVIVPLRTEGRQRRYGLEHIIIIEKVRDLKNKGLSLAEIREFLSDNNIQKDNTPVSNNLEMLSDRIAEVVKIEINRFFQGKHL